MEACVTVMDMEAIVTNLTAVAAGNLRAEMARKGYNISDLAVALGVSRHTAASRFDGTKSLTLSELPKVAAWLGLQWSDLLWVPF